MFHTIFERVICGAQIPKCGGMLIRAINNIHCRENLLYHELRIRRVAASAHVYVVFTRELSEVLTQVTRVASHHAARRNATIFRRVVVQLTQQ